MTYAGPSRRAVLAGAGLVAVTACTGPNAPSRHRRPDPDVPIRTEAVAGVRRLAELYAATLARHPGLQEPLGPLAAEHAAHLIALGAPAAAGSPSPSGSATSPSPSGTASPPPTPTVPADQEAARAALAAAEHAAAAERVRQAAAASPSLARLVAVIGGCEAAHAALLGAGR